MRVYIAEALVRSSDFCLTVTVVRARGGAGEWGEEEGGWGLAGGGRREGRRPWNGETVGAVTKRRKREETEDG